MEAKISITDACGARCVTCRQHEVRPQNTMSPAKLREVLERLRGVCGSFFINGTGDYLCLPNHQEYSDVLSAFMQSGGGSVAITTNCGFVGTPRIHCAVVICSFNAVDPATFEQCIGLPYQRVVDNIRYFGRTYGVVQVHSLCWEGNPNPAHELMRLFGDLPVRIRVSEKVENQMRSRVEAPRKYCTYLDKIVVDPLGRVKLCNHDFFGEHLLGTVDGLSRAQELRRLVQQKHQAGIFDGICTDCNFNVVDGGKVYYIK